MKVVSRLIFLKKGARCSSLQSLVRKRLSLNIFALTCEGRLNSLLSDFVSCASSSRIQLEVDLFDLENGS